MVETQIAFAVVGHHSRQATVAKLQSRFNAQVFLDEGDHGALWNHRRALEWAGSQSRRVIIMEDDAQPVVNFEEKARQWFALFPVQFLSFYLGTCRPPQWQPTVDRLITEAKSVERDFILLRKLIHGVCYSPPPKAYSLILKNLSTTGAADFEIGDAWGGQIYYPIRSLVEHADECSVEKHPDGRWRNDPRVARFLDGEIEK